MEQDFNIRDQERLREHNLIIGRIRQHIATLETNQNRIQERRPHIPGIHESTSGVEDAKVNANAKEILGIVESFGQKVVTQVSLDNHVAAIHLNFMISCMKEKDVEIERLRGIVARGKEAPGLQNMNAEAGGGEQESAAAQTGVVFQDQIDNGIAIDQTPADYTINASADFQDDSMFMDPALLS